MARVLVLGADGFIGRHIAFALRAQGFDVVASARRVSRLQAMGFEVFRADLSKPETHDSDFWSTFSGVPVVNAAGLLTGSQTQMQAVHVDAPRAVYAASGAFSVLISAIGIDAAATGFARSKRTGEDVAREAGVTILRPGLVMADTSYGGTSLARALAILPLFTPLVGDGAQLFNPIHAGDLSDVVIRCLKAPPGIGPHEIGGPERVTQAGMLAGLRGWLGLSPTRALPLPIWLARMMGRMGDLMRLGPISATAVAQLEFGAEADEAALCAKLGVTLRGFSEFLMARPAGTQDLWHARLYLMRPVLRIVLAVMWLASGIVGLTLPATTFLPLIDTNLPDAALVTMARAGGLVDLGIAAALLRGWRPHFMAGVQAVMVVGYTLAFTILAPALWLLPLGGLLKNLPVLALIAISAILEDER